MAFDGSDQVEWVVSFTRKNKGTVAYVAARAIEQNPYLLDGELRAAAQALLQPIDHRGSHEHPNWPTDECDECLRIHRDRFGALRAALG